MRIFRQQTAPVLLRFGLFSGIALSLAGNMLAATINVTFNGAACATGKGDCVDVPVAAQAAFNNMAKNYGSILTTNATIYIDVQFGTTDLGMSTSNVLYNNPTYSDWQSHLAADAALNPTNLQMVSAAASLPAGSNPVTGDVNSQVRVTTANAKALGLSLGDYGTTDTSKSNPDSIITFSKSGTFEYNSTAKPGADDFVNTAEHELDEALGISTVLKGDNSAVPSTLAAEDYFRYSGLGTHTVTNDPTATNVYFSADSGKTLLAQFNQDPGDNNADLNDWVYTCSAPGPLVQDASDCSGKVAPDAFGSPEGIVLQALGWGEVQSIGDITPPAEVPEPATTGIIGVGFVALALFGRRRRS